MFQGETAITIDDKGRLAVPTAYRDLVARECGNRLVITYNPFEAGSLYLYPVHVWERVRDQVNALPKAKKVNRSMQLKLVGAAC
ncbi:division/cell wall cluster transcriptional repressor MraZ, partial [Escherichia coli]